MFQGILGDVKNKSDLKISQCRLYCKQIKGELFHILLNNLLKSSFSTIKRVLIRHTYPVKEGFGKG